MRRCSLRTLEQELPILPFLAPRIFAPWLFDRPQQLRKVSSPARLAQSQGIRAGSSAPTGDRRAPSIIDASSTSGDIQPARPMAARGTAEQQADGDAIGTGFRPISRKQLVKGKADDTPSRPVFRRKAAPPSHPIHARVSQLVIHRVRNSASSPAVWDTTVPKSKEEGNATPENKPPQEVAAGITYNTEEGLFELEPVNEAYQRALQGDVERALILLHSHLHDGGKPADIRVKRVATVLLRRTKTGGGQYQDTSALIAAISELGIQLDIVMFNILILNAAESKDSATAWRIYRLLCEQEVQPDDYTHVILLSMCRRLGDRKTYRDLYRRLAPDTKPLGPHLFTELLACRYHFNARQNFYHLMRFFELHCDLQPLRTLGLVRPDVEQALRSRPRNENIPSRNPSHAAVALMIRAYARQSQRQDRTWRVWHSFSQALKRNDPDVIPLVSTTHTYNTFLKAFCRTENTVEQWRKILGRMKQPLAHRWQRESAMIKQTHLSKFDASSAQAPPDLQTFNIILHSCMLFGKTREATDAWALLLRQGLTPDVVSWNALLSGYARAQSVDRVAETLKAMFAANIRPDKHTRLALQRIKDVRSVKAALRAGLPHRLRMMMPRGRTTAAEKLFHLAKLHAGIERDAETRENRDAGVPEEQVAKEDTTPQSAKFTEAIPSSSQTSTPASSATMTSPPETEAWTVTSAEESLFEEPDADFAQSLEPPTIQPSTSGASIPRLSETEPPTSTEAISNQSQDNSPGNFKITKVSSKRNKSEKWNR